MRTSLTLLVVSAISTCTMLSAMAQGTDTTSQETTTTTKETKLKKVEHAPEAAVKDTGKGVKKVGHGTETVVKDAGKDTEKGVKAVGHGIKTVGKDTEKGLGKLVPHHKAAPAAPAGDAATDATSK